LILRHDFTKKWQKSRVFEIFFVTLQMNDNIHDRQTIINPYKMRKKLRLALIALCCTPAAFAQVDPKQEQNAVTVDESAFTFSESQLGEDDNVSQEVTVLGQNIVPGAAIGQINNLDSYKIQAQIDEHYIDRVTAGLRATFDRQEQHYGARLRKVYPDVRDGKFKADFLFGDTIPDNIRAGQTYYLNLQLGQSEEAVLIPRGSFYQHTGGKWIYVLTDPHRAEKRTISIGRQNPQYYEVLEGLRPGEKVLTGSYDHYGESEVLIIETKR